MDPEDKFFIVTWDDGLNVRSTGKVEEGNDLGNFDLNEGDVIHAVGTVVSEDIVFHRFDRIYRAGIRYDFPFHGFPNYVASRTEKYWSAEKSNARVWMTETKNPELPAEVPDTDNKIINDPQTPSANKYDGWRVLHKDEGGYQRTPKNMPEVLPPENPVGLDMTEAIQQMSFALMKRFNKGINEKIWTAVHNGERAFTNYQGFGPGEKSGGPRKNFITGKDLGAELPKYDKMGRVCGGMFLRGMEQGGYLVCTPGIHGIDARKPMPDIDTIVKNNWYFFAIAWYEGKNNKPGRVAHFPSGPGNEDPVAIPFIFDREIKFPIKYFKRWNANELPDPLKYDPQPK